MIFLLSALLKKMERESYCEFVRDGSGMILTNLYSSKMGDGTVMINCVAKCAINNGCSMIFLDDMSKRFRKPHNIYTKYGFRYMFSYGPEMVGRSLTVCRKTQMEMSKWDKNRNTRYVLE